MRNTTDFLSEREHGFQALAAEPYRFDFLATLRRIECWFAEHPRLGEALRPADEHIRIGQLPTLRFAPAALTAFVPPQADQPGMLAIECLGLLGPNGPLPLHITELIKERVAHKDLTLLAFLNALQHRVITLFYRAWAQAHPTVHLDRPQQDRFVDYVGATFGFITSTPANPHHIESHAQLFYAGLLMRQVRNREGLIALLSGYFGFAFFIEEFAGHWMTLPQESQARLAQQHHQQSASLGNGIILGKRVWDVQHKIRLITAPLTLAQYENFLPKKTGLAQLVGWLRRYLGLEIQWDLQLVLLPAEVPKTRLRGYGQLGWTTWLGHFRRPQPAADLVLQIAITNNLFQ